MSVRNISVVGLGYIGLPTAAWFAWHRIPVVGVDVNSALVSELNAGVVRIVERDLESLVKQVVSDGLFFAQSNPAPADAYIITVPTPFMVVSDNSAIPEPDLSYVEAAARSIASVLRKGDIVILESTSPVGTTEKLSSWLAEERPDLTFPLEHGEAADVNIAYCPERILPGNAIAELVENDRVIGGITPRCSNRAKSLYERVVQGKCTVTDARTAEMTKLTENASRDVSIAFANELSLICDRLGINVRELISLANKHPRVDILQPGPGVGGHCIAVDPWFIVSSCREEAALIKKAREINDAKPAWVVNKVFNAINILLLEDPDRDINQITIACYGLSFKKNIDDLRESPALAIVSELYERHPGPIKIIEPNLRVLPSHFGNCSFILAPKRCRMPIFT